ncbi:extracellular matrix-binding ebh [Babesia caballi]|uniref:Extracellular matrix-binding ebh n=1 Tax=Babesia caballi TaxID=5871 RepID=A0AAV4LTG7_BABCB|nr:extracellular matrix-binding ebh [Babesia caballi]
MVGSGYKVSELNDGMMGSHLFISAMKEDNFKDFKEGITKAVSTATERATKEKEAKQKLYPGASTSQSSSTSAKPTYPEFIKELCQRCSAESLSTISNDKPLSSLYYICRLYFQSKQKLQSELPNLKLRPPSTIREMLYFLAALPFSPAYDSLNEHITSVFKNLSPLSSTDDDAVRMIPVADSSKGYTPNSPGDTLSAANLKDYLMTTCSLSITVLGTLQGSGASEKPSEPWFHELFSNSAFYLNYPSSGPTLFSMLSNYTYALQFQLYFLYAQCYNYSSRGCGWRGCRFGSTIQPNGSTTAPSHICSINIHNSGSTCGQNASQASPLQAFLTDNLKGFSLSPKSTSGHLSDHPPGSMCHVKMGFTPQSLRQNAGTGNYLYSTLKPFCGSPVTPLRQLSEKLGCLTKRTPRTLGDLFGFIWHLNGQLFKNTRPTLQNLIGKFYTAFGLQNPSQNFVSDPYSAIIELWNKMAEIKSKKSQSSKPNALSMSLESMAPVMPFIYQLFMAKDPNSLPGTLFDLTQHCHNLKHDNQKNVLKHLSPDGKSQCSHSRSNPADLWSLYHPITPAPERDTDTQQECRSGSCGGYLEPLTLTYGATFSPSAAPRYLSWTAYLTDDLFERLQNMLDDFTNIDCKASGCQGQQCQHGPASGHHGSVYPQCACTSVVSCSGVLPLFYEHGFQFNDAYSLNGGKAGGDQTKRTCAKFSQQLSNVLSPDAPLAKLLESIDSFLYLFRFYFFYNLSSFWLCSLVILLYFIVYGIDVSHVKSHVHLPSSHNVPPIGLLATGKTPVLTKLTYYMP